MADIRPLEIPATDAEALQQARSLMTEYLCRVEVVSVGCPTEISDTPGRVLVFVTARKDGKGWMLKGEMMHGSWHRVLEDAVSYGEYRTVGYESEMRIRNAKGEVTHVVLIPVVLLSSPLREIRICN
jgi:hypothetical protein